jgi:hypothetical protein
MNVGLGTTVLVKGEASGHIDGIAIYTKHLLEKLPYTGIDIERFAFIEKYGADNTIPLGKFSILLFKKNRTKCEDFSCNRSPYT